MSLRKIWDHKWKILDGLWHRYFLFVFFKDSTAKKIADKRQSICFKCPHLDAKGLGENVVVKGWPACGICGCNIQVLTASLSSECSLSDIGETPKWNSYD